jgi:lysophospholipase L1-like esterase
MQRLVPALLLGAFAAACSSSPSEPGGAAAGSAGAAAGGAAGSGGSAVGAGAGGSSGAAGASGGVSGSAGAATEPGLRWLGRVDASDPAAARFSYSQSGFETTFSGSGATVELSNDASGFGADYYFTAVVDGVAAPMLAAGAGDVSVEVAAGLADGTHTLQFFRQTEGQAGITSFRGLTVAGGALGAPPPGSERLIEIVGDSITCGYGNLCNQAPEQGFSTDTESAYDTYGAVAGRVLDAEVALVAVSGRGVARNNDGSTANTMPLIYEQVHPTAAAPLWTFARIPQAVVINLGTNDFAQGDPGEEAYVGAMSAFVTAIRGRYPDAFIVLAAGPMLSDYYPPGVTSLTLARSYLNTVVSELADERVSFFEFASQMPSEYGCDYHPMTTRHAIMGEALAAELAAKLGW